MVDRIDILETTLVRAELSLGNHKYQDGLGPDAVLRECDVRFRTGSVTIVRTSFEDCKIRGSSRLRSMRFDQARFVRCRFVGRFLGGVFGNYLRLGDDWNDAGVYDCDLSEAWLHLTRFHRCQVRRNRWPGWPQVVISLRSEDVEDWMSLVLPAQLRWFQQDAADALREYGPDTVLVEDVSTKGELEGAPGLRALLASRSYVHVAADSGVRSP